MLQRFSKCLVIVALVFAIGGHWAVLQTTAWVGMTISYSQTDSFFKALEKTFDGKHPCQLCKFVKEGKKSEQKSEAQLDLKKLDFFSEGAVKFQFAPLAQTSTDLRLILLPRSDAPPTPPPLVS